MLYTAGGLEYSELVDEMKRKPNSVTLMALQPYEKEALLQRGIELSSKTCPCVTVVGRRGPDDTTNVSIAECVIYHQHSLIFKYDVYYIS